MGLDIYAGTLTRYYTHNWKTAVQQWAEENGYTFSKITPDGETVQEEDLNPAEVQEAVESWRDQLLTAITPEGRDPYAGWPEGSEKPYFTDKPDWEAFEALLLYGACRIYGEPVPPSFSKRGQYEDFPIAKRIEEDEKINWSLYSGVTWWLPLEDSFYFQGPLPTDDIALIATAGALTAELKKINELGWQADEDTIWQWSETEGYPADAERAADGTLSVENIPEQTQYDTESLAKFAFSILWKAAKFSLEQRVPILMDF